MTYIKVNGTLYPAEISGRMSDASWDGRATKSITLSMTVQAAAALLPGEVSWSICCDREEPVTDEDGNQIIGDDGQPQMQTVQDEYDNSDYNLSGDITDHRDGTVTIKMGKPTDLEDAYAMLLGGDDA